MSSLAAVHRVKQGSIPGPSALEADALPLSHRGGRKSRSCACLRARLSPGERCCGFEKDVSLPPTPPPPPPLMSLAGPDRGSTPGPSVLEADALPLSHRGGRKSRSRACLRARLSPGESCCTFKTDALPSSPPTPLPLLRRWQDPIGIRSPDLPLSRRMHYH